MLTNSHKHKNGRPSKTSQLEIQRELRSCFEQGIYALLTAEKTGINIKTVCKYFDFWTQEIIESEESDFLERQKKERTRILVSLDNQIIDAYKLLDSVDEEIKKIKEQHKAVPIQLFFLRLAVMRQISALIEKKGSFAMQPIMDEALQKKILEIAKKHERT